jgi:hypothetical protein
MARWKKLQADLSFHGELKNIRTIKIKNVGIPAITVLE